MKRGRRTRGGQKNSVKKQMYQEVLNNKFGEDYDQNKQQNYNGNMDNQQYKRRFNDENKQKHYNNNMDNQQQQRFNDQYNGNFRNDGKKRNNNNRNSYNNNYDNNFYNMNSNRSENNFDDRNYRNDNGNYYKNRNSYYHNDNGNYYNNHSDNDNNFDNRNYRNDNNRDRNYNENDSNYNNRQITEQKEVIDLLNNKELFRVLESAMHDQLLEALEAIEELDEKNYGPKINSKDLLISTCGPSCFSIYEKDQYCPDCEMVANDYYHSS
jgi:hypothetical protein